MVIASTLLNPSKKNDILSKQKNYIVKNSILFFSLRYKMQNQAKLYLDTDQLLIFSYFKYQLIINGEKLPTFKAGEEQVLPIPCGEVTVEIKQIGIIFKKVSDILTIDVHPNSNHLLKFSNRRDYIKLYSNDQETQAYIKIDKKPFVYYLNFIWLALFSLIFFYFIFTS
jgi:hypothetical protein